MVELVLATSCPKCGSTDIRRRSEYHRKVRALYGVRTFVVTQHCCRQCNTAFTDGIGGVRKGGQIADEVTRKAVDIYLEGPDLEEVVKRLREDLHAQISASTIWRRVDALGKTARGIDAVRGTGLKLSKFVCVDEKYVPVHGDKKPLFLGLDPLTNVPVVQKLLRNREVPAVLPLMRRLKSMKFEVCISDDWKSYPLAVKAVGMRHQKCHFHAKQAVWRILKKKHIQKKRKAKFKRWLFAFLDSKSIAEAMVWLRIIGRIKAEKKLARFMQSFLYNWRDYFTYLDYDGCPKTNNPMEQYNRRFEQKRQTMHGFRKERTTRSFIALFILHSLFRKFETGKNKGIAPVELAGGTQLIAKGMYGLLAL